MRENIATIPLIDAFKADGECPFCHLEREAEQHAISFILGSAYIWTRTPASSTMKKCAASPLSTVPRSSWRAPAPIPVPSTSPSSCLLYTSQKDHHGTAWRDRRRSEARSLFR